MTVIHTEAPGQVTRAYRVGTFYDKTLRGRKSVSAYTLYYSAEWQGCIEYEVWAVNGTVARRAATDARLRHEGLLP